MWLGLIQSLEGLKKNKVGVGENLFPIPDCPELADWFTDAFRLRLGLEPLAALILRPLNLDWGSSSLTAGLRTCQLS